MKDVTYKAYTGTPDIEVTIKCDPAKKETKVCLVAIPKSPTLVPGYHVPVCMSLDELEEILEFAIEEEAILMRVARSD